MEKRSFARVLSEAAAVVCCSLAIPVMLTCCLFAPIPAVRFLEPDPLPETRAATGKLPDRRHETSPQPVFSRWPLLKVRYS